MTQTSLRWQVKEARSPVYKAEWSRLLPVRSRWTVFDTRARQAQILKISTQQLSWAGVNSGPTIQFKFSKEVNDKVEMAHKQMYATLVLNKTSKMLLKYS